MSTQAVQYIMWGVNLPYVWHEEWEKKHPGEKDFYSHFDDLGFMNDSAWEPGVTHKEGIFCAFDGRDGKFIIIGRVLHKAQHGDYLALGEPVSLGDYLSGLEKELITDSIRRNFGVTGEPGYWIFTQLR